jgi:hypothetical protein
MAGHGLTGTGTKAGARMSKIDEVAAQVVAQFGMPKPPRASRRRHTDYWASHDSISKRGMYIERARRMLGRMRARHMGVVITWQVWAGGYEWPIRFRLKTTSGRGVEAALYFDGRWHPMALPLSPAAADKVKDLFSEPIERVEIERITRSLS